MNLRMLLGENMKSTQALKLSGILFAVALACVLAPAAAGAVTGGDGGGERTFRTLCPWQKQVM